jgi:DNA-binding transcriptional MerR regulator
VSHRTEGRWRLAELVEMSTRFTEPGGQSRRVRWEPNERLIRYYTTLGLLDRPAELRGRTAYYGDRHLLQLLAIKALQAQGVPLQEIQATLAGRTQGELQELAGLPDDWREQTHAAPGEVGRAETSSPPPRFWERRAVRLDFPPEQPDEPEAEMPLQGLELAPGVTLMIDRRRYPSLDPRQLSRLAAPLMQVLQAWNDPKEDKA